MNCVNCKEFIMHSKKKYFCILYICENVKEKYMRISNISFGNGVHYVDKPIDASDFDTSVKEANKVEPSYAMKKVVEDSLFISDLAESTDVYVSSMKDKDTGVTNRVNIAFRNPFDEMKKAISLYLVGGYYNASKSLEDIPTVPELVEMSKAKENKNVTILPKFAGYVTFECNEEEQED